LTGEEYAAAGGTGPRLWSIDPIDGTSNLVHQLPLWAISIGLLEAGEPVLGVIVIPPLNETYWAVKGGGAWRDGTRLLALDADTFHNQDNVCVGTNALQVLDPRSLPGRLRNLGSACCEQVFVAANRFRACTFLGEGLHDIAAGTVIAAEAGCQFGTVDGEILTPAAMVARAPITRPTFVAPPRRLRALMAAAKLLPSQI
jgi:fructose-1,6-bisphosphatase/inositol monophosphatase family enzyme